jgi:hypothetical protein
MFKRLLGAVAVVTDQVGGAAEVATDLARSSSAGEPVGDTRDAGDTVDRDSVEDKASNVGSSHGGTADAVGGAVAGVPGRENGRTGSKDVKDCTVVGVRGNRPAAVDSTDGDSAGSRGRRGVGGVGTIVSSSNGRDDTRSGSRVDSVVERSRVATTERQVHDRAGSSALGDDVVGGPVETSQNDRGARRAALEDLDSLDGGFLGDTVGLAGNGARDVSTVANGIGIVATEGSVDGLSTTLKFIVGGSNTSVDNVGICVGTSIGIVDVAGGSTGTVRDRAESPRGATLSSQGTLCESLFLFLLLDPVDDPLAVLFDDSNLD